MSYGQFIFFQVIRLVALLIGRPTYCFKNIFRNESLTWSSKVIAGVSISRHTKSHGDLVYKLRRVTCEANLVSSGSKIVKRLQRRKYDPVIIERTICLVLDPSTALYRSFHCTLPNKATGLYDGTCPNFLRGDKAPILVPSRLLVGTPELPSRRVEHSLLWRMPLYIFDILFLSPYMCVIIFMASPL